MKEKALKYIFALLGTGIGITTIANYTGNDYDNIDTHTLPKHISKRFKQRSLDKPLYITLHHTAGSKTQDLDNIAKGQINRGFAEIAYHFAIYQDGSFYALNDLEEISWHDSGQNTNSISIVFVGNYQEYILSQWQILSAKRLIDAIGGVVCIKGIRGHRDTSPTLCPGKYAYKQLKEENILW